MVWLSGYCYQYKEASLFSTIDCRGENGKRIFLKKKVLYLFWFPRIYRHLTWARLYLVASFDLRYTTTSGVAAALLSTCGSSGSWA